MTIKPFIKRPNERQFYSIDWTDDGFLAEDETISSSLWTVPVGLTQHESDSIDSENIVTTIWIDGGEHGQEYLITNKITTSLGRIAEGAVKIICRN